MPDIGAYEFDGGVSLPVPDTTKPAITLLGAATVNVFVDECYTDPGATATDDVDGDITPQIVATSTVNTAIAGSYAVTYTVSDTAGNAASAVVRRVTVSPIVDTAKPAIALLGAASVSLSVGATYVDAGATASDNVDGDLTSRIVRSGSVNTAVAGVYILTYNVSDAAGNAATPALRTVTVVASSSGTTYYVSASTGNNNNSGLSPSKAWKTIQKAAITMPAGSTVLVAPGNYAERVTPAKTGTSAKPITYKATGAGVVTQGFTVSGLQYIVIDGLSRTRRLPSPHSSGCSKTVGLTFKTTTLQRLQQCRRSATWATRAQSRRSYPSSPWGVLTPAWPLRRASDNSKTLAPSKPSMHS